MPRYCLWDFVSYKGANIALLLYDNIIASKMNISPISIIILIIKKNTPPH